MKNYENYTSYLNNPALTQLIVFFFSFKEIKILIFKHFGSFLWKTIVARIYYNSFVRYIDHEVHHP